MLAPSISKLFGEILNESYKDQFLKAAEDWACDSYSIDIRYVARKSGGKSYLLGAAIGLSPLPPTASMGFSLETNDIQAGQIQLANQNKQVLFDVLKKAAEGKLEVSGLSFELFCDREYGYHSDLVSGEKWFSELKLYVNGARNDAFSLSHIDACKIDDALRQSSPPFDGLSDLAGWLGLSTPLHSHESPVITISVFPPVDLIISESSLKKNVLNLVFYAHPNFELSRLDVALRAVPGIGVKSRRQVGSEVKWKLLKKGVRKGLARINLQKADSVLTMLVIGNQTVRRQWFIDQTKSENNRLISVQHFDKDLRMLKTALFDSSDSRDQTRFEMGVSLLFFLLGFSSAVQLESDSPDLVVTTPWGRIILVECTTRIADFSSKLGKLVDRKRSLTKILQERKNPTRVEGVLVCALPKDQIAIRTNELQAHQVILATKDDLLSALEKLRFHIDPDKFIDDALAQMARDESGGNGIFPPG